jgi:hypothetical protein
MKNNTVSLSISIDKRQWSSGYQTASYAYNDGKDPSYPLKEVGNPIRFVTSEDGDKIWFRASGDRDKVVVHAVTFIKWNSDHLNDSIDWEKIAKIICDEQ